MRTRPPTYTEMVAWIALNDDPGETDAAVVMDQVTVALVADVTGRSAGAVAADVVRYRRKGGAQ